MASEREKAKQAIQKTELKDSELNDALAAGSEYQHRMEAEKNRHKEAMHQADLGGIGRILGGEKNAPLAIASLVVVAGILFLIFSAFAAWKSQTPDSSEYWSRMIERSTALIATGLSFIFGRSGKR
jgi:hypothetical protein